MDSNNSLSKAIFTLQNGMNGSASGRRSAKFRIPITPFDVDVGGARWNDEFEHMWNMVNTEVEAFLTKQNENSLNELMNFVETSYATNDAQYSVGDGSNYLPVAALLTGINKPDHHKYFKSFADLLIEREHKHIAMLPAHDCPNIKSTIEALVSSIISGKFNFKDDDEEDIANENKDVTEILSDDDSMDESAPIEPQIKLKRHQNTMKVLRAWYANQHKSNLAEMKPKICIIIPNFEEFIGHVMQDLIQILSNNCKCLPFVLILGVATSTSTIFQSLSVNETTKIKLRAFIAHPATTLLNTITEEILLTPKLPFHLSGHVLQSLTDVFLFYDFTISQFMDSFKYCMLEHFSQGNEYSVCSSTYGNAKARLVQLDANDLENIRKLPSFRAYIAMILEEQPGKVVQLLTDDNCLRDELYEFTADVYAFLLKFDCYIRVLLVMVKNLPLSPLGKTLHSLYGHCCNLRVNIVDTEAFNNCCRMVEGMAKEELQSMIMECMATMEEYQNVYCPDDVDDADDRIAHSAREAFKETLDGFMHHALELQNAQFANARIFNGINGLQKLENRENLQQKLLEMSQQTKQESNLALRKFVAFVRNDVIGRHLLAIQNAPPLMELFVFTKSDFLKAHVNGAPRGAVDTALTNPRSYIDCACCKVDNTGQLLPTMPDISIAYKLLLENGQNVNLYDWLQSFWSILADEEEDTDEVPPLIQAKFTRARTELELLGYIKSSKWKTDHVTKLIW